MIGNPMMIVKNLKCNLLRLRYIFDAVPGQLQLFQCLLLRLEELGSRQPRSNLATSNLFFQTFRSAGFPCLEIAN